MDQKDIDALNDSYNFVPAEFIRNSQETIRLFGPYLREAQSLLSSPSAKMAQKAANSMPSEVIEYAQAINKFLNQNRASIAALLKIAARFSEAVNKEDDTKIAKEILTQDPSEPLSDTLDEVERSLVAVQKVDWDEVNQLDEDEEVPSAITQPLEGNPVYDRVRNSLGFEFKRITKQALIRVPLILQTAIQTLLPYAVPVAIHYDDVRREKMSDQIEEQRFNQLMEAIKANPQFQESLIDPEDEQSFKNQNE